MLLSITKTTMTIDRPENFRIIIMLWLTLDSNNFNTLLNKNMLNSIFQNFFVLNNHDQMFLSLITL